eukprot:TRINITY_DN389_c0_g1_i1.p1 TRINITY_DN389_c0_g1~~TRINITY_DN389_c0_g1_i1.p1  ORF type:complete len:356 (+),score=60.62 TRINITY_DN389_c0_g1_i1:154-1221(+)
MGLIRNVLRGLVSRKVYRRTLQEELDTYKMCLLLDYNNKNIENHLKRVAKHKEDNGNTTKWKEDVPIDPKEIDKLGYLRRKQFLFNHLNKQTSSLFQHVQDNLGGGFNPYPPHKPDPLSDVEKKLEKEAPVEMKYFDGAEIKHPGGFSLRVKKSLIDHPESGYGVYLSGHCIPGTLIGIYPGVVYSIRDLTDEVVNDNDYMISRYDGYVVNGRKWDQDASNTTKKSVQLPYLGVNLESKALRKYNNPFGIGQYINHPAPGSKPNVMAYAYNFPNDWPDEFKDLVPNRNFESKSPLWDFFGPEMRSVLIFATQHIVDSEVTLNYRYNPNNPYPDWYEQPDIEEAKRRWGKKNIWGI